MPHSATRPTAQPGLRVFCARSVRYNDGNMQPNSLSTRYYGASAQYNKSGNPGGRLLKLALLILVIIVLLSGGFIAFTALTSAGKNDAARLIARERQLLSFLSSNQGSIGNDDFQTANSNAISLTPSDLYALQQGLRLAYGLTAVPDAIAKAEVDTTSAGVLKTAQIQSRFDAAYLQLLRDKIASTESLARSVMANSSGTFKTAIQTQLNNLVIIDNQLAKIQL